MTNDEFTILDELYFVTAYADLKENCEADLENNLDQTLFSLIEKNWVGAMLTVDKKLPLDAIEKENLQNYFFLATKKGLLAHNS